MLARIASTLSLWIITILVLYYFDSYGWTAIITLLSAAALYETTQLLKKMGLQPLSRFAQIASFTICVAVSINASAGSLAFVLFATILALSVLKSPYSDYVLKSVIPTICLILFIPFMLHWLVVLGFLDGGIILAIWVVAAAKFSDVGAYVVGCAFGRHKMAPTMSPQKSWEGAVGGVLSSAVISAGIFWGVGVFAGENYAEFNKVFTPPLMAFAGMIIGATAILSDLLESVLKRRAEVKDSGAIIPGIGGALDLADSIILSAPVGFFVITLIVLI